MPKKIRKAVFPVAGLGTRFLPATKANPKEMLPVVDKPLIQYAAEEAVAAGVTELIFVTGRSKRSIPDHFDKAYELEAELEARGKTQLLEEVRSILPSGITCVYIRQADALGLGHAVLCAEPVVGNEPFAVILADDLIAAKNGTSGLGEMVNVFDYQGCSILGTERVPMEEASRYGVISGDECGERLWHVNNVVEKPAPEDVPSNIAVVGRYILTPNIFEKIRSTPKGAGGEYQLTDAIASLLKSERVLAYEFEGKRYDCGDKLGYLQATVEYALRHPELKAGFAEYLKQLNPDEIV